MKDKIAFVCQRYGLEVNGGSELYCRQLAEKLVQNYQVEVYTTCAEDYISWRNYYAPGDETLNGVVIHRFSVTRPRRQKQFNRISKKVLGSGGHSQKEEREWLEEQGPLCDELLEELFKNKKNYKAIFFMTYLYYITAIGLPMGFENGILIPTVHDEAPVYLSHYDKVFDSARGFVWNTQSEKLFALKRFSHIEQRPSIMAGIGVDIPQQPLPPLPQQLQDEEYLVYAGRIDESKGCGELFYCFQKYLERRPSCKLKLVLLGKAVMPVPNNENIIPLGFVSNEMKFAIMGGAKALVLFSQFESLSMVVLESMTMGRPVLVNGRCEVLREHCINSNAGLYFESEQEFEAVLDYLMEHDKVYEIMCQNAVEYVQQNYRWETVLQRFQELIDLVSKNQE